MKVRVSFIEYLNSVPLGWSFLHGRHRDVFQLLFDVPSRCARHLSEGRADVGLIPVIEYQRIPGLRVLPGISISSRREVRSVLFLSRVPMDQVGSVSLDVSSRTSAVLLKILLERFYGRTEVSYAEAPPDTGRMLRETESALVIGNAALNASRDGLYVYDLAREWNRFTGLPFVFAFWAVREGVELGRRVSVFYESREEGLREVDAIAELYSRRLGLSPRDIRGYILENLDYSLDAANLEALETFFRLAHGLELIPLPRPIDFYSA